MRDGCLEGVETIVERQYGVLAERNCESLLFGAEHRRVRCLRPHRGIIDEVALLPLCYRLRVEVVASGELFDRSLRSLYRSSDDVSGLGAAVKYLSHRASRNVGSDCLIPRHSGTTQLVSVRRVVESYESVVIQGWWPDSRRVTDVDEQEPRTLRPQQVAISTRRWEERRGVHSGRRP